MLQAQIWVKLIQHSVKEVFFPKDDPHQQLLNECGPSIGFC